MATILCISSQTVRGYVGGSATRVALERLGHQVWLLPTVILSNHPGHAVFAGEQVPTGRLRAMLDALEVNGWLEEVDAVLTGYMPSAGHAGFALRAAEMAMRANPAAFLLCDPILGDHPGGLYIDRSAAAAIRDDLLPRAAIATPNRFEFEWLTGGEVATPADALEAARALPPPRLLVTSLPDPEGSGFCNLLAQGAEGWRCDVPVRPFAPHGTGDLLAGLYLGHILNGTAPEDALARAVAGVEAALALSGHADELQLAGQVSWASAEPWPVTRLPAP